MHALKQSSQGSITSLPIWLQRCIHQEMSEGSGRLALEDLAQRANYSREHLNRIVKSETGKTLSILMRDYRLQLSTELLSTTDWTIARIAAHCRFGGSAYFHEAFMHHFQITPAQYRRNILHQ